MDNHFADPDMLPVENDGKTKKAKEENKIPPSFFEIFATVMKSKNDGDGFCGQELFSVTFLLLTVMIHFDPS